MISRVELKRHAREELQSIFAEPWLMALLMCLVVDLILGFASYIIIGFLILVGPLTYGLNCYFVKLSKKEEATINDVFSAFSSRFTETMLSGLVESIFIFLWSLLLIIPGIVKYYSYSMSRYLLLDNPEMKWDEAHKKSMEMMYGHKWQLFILDLSFLGWYIVGILCLGIGVLWVWPYHYATRANFYLALKGEQAPEVVEAKVSE